MAVYERETLVEAPLETVWAFHSRVYGLLALTPDWLHLECHEVDPPADAESGVAGGPDDASTSGDGPAAAVDGPAPDSIHRVLEEGTEIELSVRPFGVGPRQRWRSRIETRRREPSAAVFRDRMLEGPFDRWVHTHSFHDAGEGRTRVRDHVTYDLGEGPLHGLAGRLAVVGLSPMFRYRHRTLRQRLQSGDWDGWD